MPQFYEIGTNGTEKMFFTPNYDVGIMHQGETLDRMFVHHANKTELLLTLMAYNTIHPKADIKVPTVKCPRLESNVRALLTTFPSDEKVLESLQVTHSQFAGKYQATSVNTGLKFTHTINPESFGYTAQDENIPQIIETLFEMHKQFDSAHQELVRFAQEYQSLRK